jgi:DUF1016 N-terminal domain
MRLFFRAFPICDALRHELSWTHYRTLLGVEDEKARRWSMNEAADQGWSPGSPERQTGTLYDERLLASSDRQAVEQEAASKIEPRLESHTGRGRFSLPCACKCAASSLSACSNFPFRTQFSNRRWQISNGGYFSDSSRHCAPVRGAITRRQRPCTRPKLEAEDHRAADQRMARTTPPSTRRAAPLVAVEGSPAT